MASEKLVEKRVNLSITYWVRLQTHAAKWHMDKEEGRDESIDLE